MYSLFASSLVWPVLAVLMAISFHQLPMTDSEDRFEQPTDLHNNWLELGGVHLSGMLLLLAIYAAKFVIGYLPVRWMRVYYFALLVALSLPYIWFFIVVDWRNPHVFRVSCWLYDPIGIWFIPAISFWADTNSMGTPRPQWYLVRSCVELVLILPWLIVWTIFSFFFLGGGWI
jgi:hypothetical protein